MREGIDRAGEVGVSVFAFRNKPSNKREDTSEIEPVNRVYREYGRFGKFKNDKDAFVV